VKIDLPTVLTIAGFDPTGGAGIIADIQTLIRFECRPVAAITSLTFQNSKGVFGAIHQTSKSLREQVLRIIEDGRVAAVKVGMLPTGEIALEVARLIREAGLAPPVIDPVMSSSSGYELMENAAMEILLSDLLPMARLMTPNIPEAEKLADMTIVDEIDMREAATKWRQLGARAVLIKGGHLKHRSWVRSQESERGSSPTAREGSNQAVDVLDDEGQVTVFRGEWIDAAPVRGTGCMLSSAIAACLAKGMHLSEAVGAAKQFVATEIQNSAFRTQN